MPYRGRGPSGSLNRPLLRTRRYNGRRPGGTAPPPVVGASVAERIVVGSLPATLFDDGGAGTAELERRHLHAMACREVDLRAGLRRDRA